MLTAKWYSFPLSLSNVVNLTDIMNNAYNESKLPISGIL